MTTRARIEPTPFEWGNQQANANKPAQEEQMRLARLMR